MPKELLLVIVHQLMALPDKLTWMISRCQIGDNGQPCFA